MKTTKIIALILALVMCFACTGCRMVSDDKRPDATPLLYKVTDDSGNVVWLFGSIHVGREDFYPLPEYVTDAFSNSDALAVEADIVVFERDIQAQMEALAQLVYVDGTTISDHVSAETYDAAVQILEENELYNMAYDYYVPSFWSSLIDNCAYMQLGVDMEGGIDRHLLIEAKEAGKEVLEVESAAFQYGMLGGFSEELQEYLLDTSVESYADLDLMDEELNEMMDLWASGNEDEFAAYLNEEVEFEDETEEQIYEEYITAMITERNANMADYAEDALKSGKEVFICVGAAHVVGEGAMAEELASRGYTVELVK